MVRIMRFLLVVMRLMREFVFFIRLAAPWVSGAILFTVSLMATSVASLWIGVPTSIKRISDEWLDRAFFAGFPSIWMPQLYYIIWALALVTVIAGWILAAYLTVFITRLIF